MFDLAELAEQAILVHVNFPQEHSNEDLQELTMLVASANVIAMHTVTANRRAPDTRASSPRLYMYTHTHCVDQARVVAALAAPLARQRSHAAGLASARDR